MSFPASEKHPHDTGASDPGEASNSALVADPETARAREGTMDPQREPEKQSKAATAIVLVSVLLSMFLVGLDRTIISTAIPAISDEFDSLSDVGWYGSAYLLTCCAFQLLFGRIYTLFPVKHVLVASIALFEAASVICGAAPNSVAFILGRAICGVGAAGLFAGTIAAVIHVVPLRHRPKIQGMFGALFGLSSIVGPLVGGAFTSHVTWRWCFYINLPFGAAALAVVLFFLKVPGPDGGPELPLGRKVVQLDLLGTAVLAPGVVCLLLALQWGGPTYQWSDGRIIALLTLAGVLLIAYLVVQAAFPRTASLPGRIMKQRSVVSALWATLCINSANYTFVYYLPIWFQAVVGVSAVDSGIRLLPLMLSTVVGSISGGFFNSKIGYYTPLAMVGSCIMTVGAGMLTTLQVDSGAGEWIGYQVLNGLGLGLCFQTPNLAVQTALPKKDTPMGLALMFFGGLIGSTVFVSVGQNVLSNELVRRLSGFPGFDARLVTSGGATAILDAIPAEARGPALQAYNEALREVFKVGLVVSCLSVLGTFSLEWLSVKKPEVSSQGAPSSESEVGPEKEAGKE